MLHGILHFSHLRKLPQVCYNSVNRTAQLPSRKNFSVTALEYFFIFRCIHATDCDVQLSQFGRRHNIKASEVIRKAIFNAYNK